MQEMPETWAWSLGLEDPLEEGMTTHSSILAWRTPWTEEPSGLQSMGMQRVIHEWNDLGCMHAWVLLGWSIPREQRKVFQTSSTYLLFWGGFPGGSDGKESAYNAEDQGSIPGSGRSPGEQNGMAIYSSPRLSDWHWTRNGNSCFKRRVSKRK